jgi:hypothetical protein
MELEDCKAMKNQDWIELLSEANAAKGDKVPEGFYPMAHWLNEFRIGETTWRRHVPVFIESGKFTVGYYRIIKDGRAVKVPFWKRK